ncbi:primosomal protein N' (replication factor Y) - superfamily II helicase [Frigidibacter sp. MR17.24]|uniref:primosomal protein N' (replication factor Y) - superfamily II helicase n=1 Tax=Frigidibacter sp. MR17.24 TaxID=3127345 RepID=UPI003012EE6C
MTAVPPLPAPDADFHAPCTACGADLRFAPGQTVLVCDHCGNRQEITARFPGPWKQARTGIEEMDLARGLADDLPAASLEQHRTTSCPNCGAVVEFPGAEHAAECPFCATPVVIGTGQVRLIKPQALVPFEIPEQAAREALGRWLKSRWFAPNGLSDYARRGRRLTGVYTPFWTFDAATESAYAGQRGDAYYVARTVTVNGQRRTEQERRVRWSPVRGRVARVFDDVLVPAGRSHDAGRMRALEPWGLGALQPYRPDWLAGFLAEGYTVALADGHDRAREIMAGVIAGDVRAAIGGDEQRVERIDTRHSAETFKHVLLPVWTAAYRFRGRSYACVINGQTGRVAGERPYSPWKIAGAVALALIALALVAWLQAR